MPSHNKKPNIYVSVQCLDGNKSPSHIFAAVEGDGPTFDARLLKSRELPGSCDICDILDDEGCDRIVSDMGMVVVMRGNIANVRLSFLDWLSDIGHGLLWVSDTKEQVPLLLKAGFGNMRVMDMKTWAWTLGLSWREFWGQCIQSTDRGSVLKGPANTFEWGKRGAWGLRRLREIEEQTNPNSLYGQQNTIRAFVGRNEVQGVLRAENHGT